MPHKDLEVRREYHREYGKRNRNAARKRSEEWNKRHPGRQKLLTRKWLLKSKFGLSLEDYDALFEAQGGACAICGTSDTSPWEWLCVDHDHVTGRVRGLLCHSCNVCIGQAKDDPRILRRALEYLERPWSQ